MTKSANFDNPNRQACFYEAQSPYKLVGISSETVPSSYIKKVSVSIISDIAH